MNTPKTNSVVHYLAHRQSFEKTDHQVWREHSTELEIQLNMANKRLNAYETHLATVMSPEWLNADATERPLLARLEVEGLRYRLKMFEDHLESQRKALESRTRDPKTAL